MKFRCRWWQWFVILTAASSSLMVFAQARPFPGPDVQQIYQRLLPQVEKIPIFDHHAHPGFPDDPDVDAMAAPPGSAALRERDSNLELVAAAQALFGYPYIRSSNREENQKRGGIAMKFEVAYFRSTKFSDPPRQQAEQIYQHYVNGGVPAADDYRIFQDYIFRYLISEGGRLHLPVHIHSAVGIGDYFNISEGNIMNLENILRDPRYSGVTFVMIHGGYPLEREAIWLAAVKNVYMHSSLMEIAMYPSEFKNSLKQWLETFLDKITFGTDAFPYNDVLGAEESYWLGVQSSRQGLAAALAEMVSMGQVSESKALEMAHGYLHDNAIRIYEGKVQ